MADRLSALVGFRNSSIREKVIFILAEETRPEFAEELDSTEGQIFEQLDGVEYPENMVLVGDTQLFIWWWSLEETLEEIAEKLERCGGLIQKAQCFLEDIWTDDTMDGMYYKRVNNRFELVDPKERKLKMPKDYESAENLPAELQALLQEF